jgi:hypothetical protein
LKAGDDLAASGNWKNEIRLLDKPIEDCQYSYLPDLNRGCSHSVYGELYGIIPTPEEIIPQNTPPSLVKHVTHIHYGESKLMHDVMSGRSVYDILHMVISVYDILYMVNKTTREWFSKKPTKAEAATCGSEFGATQICVEQIFELRSSVSYLLSSHSQKDPLVWRQQVGS